MLPTVTTSYYAQPAMLTYEQVHNQSKRISYPTLRDGIANRARGAEGIRARPEGDGAEQDKREA